MFVIGPIPAAIMSAIGFGFADFMGGRVAVRLGAPLAVVVVQVFATLCVLVIVVFGGYPVPAGRDFYLSVVAGATDGAALVFLYRGLSAGRIAVVAPLAGVCSIAVPSLLEMVFLTRVGPEIVAGIAVSAFAVILISQSSHQDNQGKALSTSILLGLVAGVMFGLTNYLLGLMDPIHANGGTLVMRASAIVAATAVLVWQFASVKLDRKGLWLGSIAGALDGLGMMGLVYSATTGLIGVAASINALYAGVTVLLGVVVLGERLGRIQMAGLALGAVAIMLLARGQ